MASVERAVCGVSTPNMRILSGSQPSEALFSNVFDAVVLWLSGVMSGCRLLPLSGISRSHGICARNVGLLRPSALD